MEVTSILKTTAKYYHYIVQGTITIPIDIDDMKDEESAIKFAKSIISDYYHLNALGGFNIRGEEKYDLYAEEDWDDDWEDEGMASHETYLD